jgi:hypothetical protein
MYPSSVHRSDPTRAAASQPHDEPTLNQDDGGNGSRKKRKLTLTDYDIDQILNSSLYARLLQQTTAEINVHLLSLQKDIAKVANKLQKLQHHFGTAMALCLEKSEVAGMLSMHPEVCLIHSIDVASIPCVCLVTCQELTYIIHS